jgi:hypothetical protein
MSCFVLGTLIVQCGAPPSRAIHGHMAGFVFWGWARFDQYSSARSGSNVGEKNSPHRVVVMARTGVGFT